ncbi:MAG: cation:proton antiporter [Pseudomonadota bacterium]
MHHSADILHDVIIFLVAAGLLVPIIQRFAISPVLAFIVIGLFIGPFGLGSLSDDYPWLSGLVITNLDGVQTFAELGVVFLLFMIGMELSIERLISMRVLVFGLGGLQVLLTSIAIGSIAYAFGNTPEASIVIGACLALSSTAIVMQLLIESHRLATPTGRKSFSILLFQDLAVVPILFLTGIFGETGNSSMIAGLGLALVKAAAVIGLIFLIGRLVIRPIFHFVGAAKSRELFMAMVLLAIIGTAVLTEQAGLSLALGAFLAGLLLAETEYRHQIEVDVEPFKGLLLGLFFMSVGMSLDLSAVLNDPIRIVASVIGLFILKSTIIYALARLFGVANPVATETALLLGQGGEFAFVVLSVALTLNVVPKDTAQFILIVAALSMLVTPVVARFAKWMNAKLTPPDDPAATHNLTPPDPTGDELDGHIIVAGYGRVGQLLGSLLDNQRIPYVGLDLDIATVSKYRNLDCPIYFGNAHRPEILNKLNINNASAFVVTMDNHEAAAEIVKSVRAGYPNLPIIVRARDKEHALELLDNGATSVVPETVEASLDLAEVVFGKVGIGAETARQIVADRRQIERAALTL